MCSENMCEKYGERRLERQVIPRGRVSDIQGLNKSDRGMTSWNTRITKRV